MLRKITTVFFLHDYTVGRSTKGTYLQWRNINDDACTKNGQSVNATIWFALSNKPRFRTFTEVSTVPADFWRTLSSAALCNPPPPPLPARPHTPTSSGSSDRALERSRAGRWSWALIAGRIVLLLSCKATIKQARDSKTQRRSRAGRWSWAFIASWMGCLAAEL